MPLHSSVSNLPPAYFALAPELGQLTPPPERASDCSNCPMVAQPTDLDPPMRIVFDGDLRCCTFHPVLHNYLAGRVLRRGGLGADRVRVRMANPEGVFRWGIRPDQAYHDRARKTGAPGFGVDRERKCPYWVPEGMNCSIWRDRNAVCRTWFCKHEDGKQGHAFWHAQRDLLGILQVKLCRWLGDLLEPPAEPATVDDWATYYIACADRLDAATPEEIEALHDEGLADARTQLSERHRDLHRDILPDVVGPAVSRMHNPVPEQVTLEGYSHYNPGTWDSRVFTLFSFMDGTVSWRDALARTTEALGEAHFTEADIRELFRLGLLEARSPEDLVPGARISGLPTAMPADDSDMPDFSWDEGAKPG